MSEEVENKYDEENSYDISLRDTVIYYSNKLDSLVLSMSDAQRAQYKSAVQTAFSLIEPYRNSIKKRDDANLFERQSSDAVMKLFYFGSLLVGAFWIVDELFFAGVTVERVALILFGIGLIYALFISLSLLEHRQAQVIHENSREQYLQQWTALGLSWESLRQLVDLANKREEIDSDDLPTNDKALSRAFRRDEYKIPFEMKARLALHISERSFLVDFAEMDSDEHRSWDDLK
jgi:hypothetical protein